MEFAAKEHRGRKRTNLRFCVLVMAAVLIYALFNLPPSRKRVVGSYTGHLFEATETLVLHDDGSFSQTLLLPSGKQLDQKGTWSLKNKAVYLSMYLLFYDVEQGRIVDPPKVVSSI